MLALYDDEKKKLSIFLYKKKSFPFLLYAH